MPEGSAVLFLVGAANRDDRVFPDGDRFDIHRKRLKRFPDWEVDLEHAKLASTSTVRSWETLPAVLGEEPKGARRGGVAGAPGPGRVDARVVPLAGSILAGWGAHVIKVEDPTHGDIMRGGTVSGVPAPPRGSAHLYHVFNRGKRAAAMDLKNERSCEAVLRLAEHSDVFLTSYLSGVRRRLGIDVDDIRANK